MTKSIAKPLLKSLTAIAILLGMLTIVLIFGSCKKETVPTLDVSYLSVTNIYPTSGTFNFYLNNNKVNNGSSALPFGATVPYIQIAPGEYSAKTTTESSTESLLTKKISVEKDKVYSLFIIDKGNNMDYLQVTDDTQVPGADKAMLRFINLSPDAGSLNLGIKDGLAIGTDRAYKSAGNFLEVEAKTYTFEIKDKVSGELKAELKDIVIKAGSVYTIIARGLLNPGEAERTFSGQVITNR